MLNRVDLFARVLLGRGVSGSAGWEGVMSLVGGPGSALDVVAALDPVAVDAATGGEVEGAELADACGGASVLWAIVCSCSGLVEAEVAGLVVDGSVGEEGEFIYLVSVAFVAEAFPFCSCTAAGLMV